MTRCFALIDVFNPALVGASATAGRVLGLFWERADAERMVESYRDPRFRQDLRVAEIEAPDWLPTHLLELEEPTMTTDTYHDRYDASAWGDNDMLAFVTGLLTACLDAHSRGHWTVEAPFGYCPVIDLVTPDGRRFRLRVEEVKETT